MSNLMRTFMAGAVFLAGVTPSTLFAQGDGAMPVATEFDALHFRFRSDPP